MCACQNKKLTQSSPILAPAPLNIFPKVIKDSKSDPSRNTIFKIHEHFIKSYFIYSFNLTLLYCSYLRVTRFSMKKQVRLFSYVPVVNPYPFKINPNLQTLCHFFSQTVKLAAFSIKLFLGFVGLTTASVSQSYPMYSLDSSLCPDQNLILFTISIL